MPPTEDFWTGPGAFPLMLSTILILLTVWWVVDVLYQTKRAKKGTLKEIAFKKTLLEELVGGKGQQKRLLIIILATLVFIFVLIPVCGKISELYGFCIAVYVFLLGTIKLFGTYSWKKTMIISLVAVLGVYLVFNYALMLPMPY